MTSIRTLTRWIPSPWCAVRWGQGPIVLLRATQLSDAIAPLHPLKEVRIREPGNSTLLALIEQARQVIEGTQTVPPLLGTHVTIASKRRGRHQVQWVSHSENLRSPQIFWLRIRYDEIPTDTVITALTAVIQTAVNGDLSTTEEITRAKALVTQAHQSLPVFSNS